MCLAVFAIDQHRQWPLIVIANRDEFHARPTETMQPWDGAAQILAGRDLAAGGTWLGIDGQGRLALLTNVRDPRSIKANAPSRGQLAEKFLASQLSAHDYLEQIAEKASQYNGFNLVVLDAIDAVWHASNYQQPFYSPIEPGVHGLSNALMNTAWPKTELTCRALQGYLSHNVPLDPDKLCGILLDTTPVDDAQLPDTGLSLARERLLATPFIVSPDYGTRCTTLVLQHRSGCIWVQEDSYDPQGKRINRIRWQLLKGHGWHQTDFDPEVFVAGSL